MKKRMQFTPAVKTLAGLINDISNVEIGGLDLQPSYQRDFIWKDDYKDNLIYSIIRGYPIGNISISVLNEYNDKGAMSEVVDGQQRLTTLYNFIEKGYCVKSSTSLTIAQDIVNLLQRQKNTDESLDKLKNYVEKNKKFKLTYVMLPSTIKNNIRDYQISISNISESTQELTSEYFRFLQNQEFLRAGELINSLPNSGFEKYLDRIDKLKFLKVFNIADDKRKDFEKLFYSIIGFLDGEIVFGSASKNIQNYIVNCADVAEGNKFKVERLINGINEISKIKSISSKGTNKRFFKELLLLLSYNLFFIENFSTEEILEKLIQINQRFTSFSSIKKDAIEETFTIFDGKGEMNVNDIIEEYRAIALIFKGTANTNIVIERIEMLHDILKRELEWDRNNFN